jgi:hypothetical protein
MPEGGPVQFAKSLSVAALMALGVTALSLGAAAGAAAALPESHSVKMTLPRSIAPRPVFMRRGVCGVSVANDTAVCNRAILRAIDRARKTEPVGVIPHRFNVAAFDRLSGARQVFAMADIERTARGLPPMVGMTAQLDGVAATAAVLQIDPSVSLPLHLTRGGTATTFGSNFAEGVANAMGADYFWMYDDGLHSPNASCTKSHRGLCWAHRKNVLDNYGSRALCPPGSAIHLLMGAAEVTSGVMFSPAIGEVFVNDCGALPTHMVFTWADVQRLVFGR